MKNRWIVAAMITGLCVFAQAGIVTVTIAGTGSGTLNGASFTDKTFEWVLMYDTTIYTTPWGADSPIFLNPDSVITLQGEADSISVTQDHGFWVGANWPGHFQLAPILMTGNSPDGNILDAYGTPFWDGVSAFTASSIDSGFGQFIDITTDQGLLTMNSGTISSVVAAVPEPASAMMLIFGAGIGMIVHRARRWANR